MSEKILYLYIKLCLVLNLQTYLLKEGVGNEPTLFSCEKFK